MVLMWLHTALLGAAALVPFGLLVALMMSNWRGGGRKRRHPDDTAEQTPKTSAPLQWSSLPPPSCPDPSALSAAGGSKTGRARAPANPGHGWLPAPNTTEPAAHASPGDPERPPLATRGTGIEFPRSKNNETGKLNPVMCYYKRGPCLCDLPASGPRPRALRVGPSHTHRKPVPGRPHVPDGIKSSGA